MHIAFTTDHAGLAYGDAFSEIQGYTQELGHTVVNLGPKKLDMDDDYPDLIFSAALGVAHKKFDAAIIMGGSGQGEAMAANRIPGVHCTLFYGPVIAKQPVDAEGNMSDDPYEILKLSRQHNHANILSLSARFLTLNEMKRAIEVWLATPYSDAERHVRRVRKLDNFLLS